MIQYLDNNSVCLSFLAPYKENIHVVGEFNNWQVSEFFQMQKQSDGETFKLTIENLEPKREYAYQFLIDRKIAVADPYAEKILDPKFDSQISENTYPNLKKYPYENPFRGTVSVLQTAQTPFQWQFSLDFEKPLKENLVIYELLVRDFLHSRKYRDIVSYIPYFKKLGINVIELLPVQEFTGNDSWGYNPTFYFAADKAYGTKEDLKFLIDQCHQHGIAVILDMVFNHADNKFSYFKAYPDYHDQKRPNPFFNKNATHPFSVFNDFNHESTYTQHFIDNVCRFWLQEYKIDGFRFDLSKGFTQVETDPDVERWSSYDSSRIKLLKRIYDKIRSYDAECYLILEHLAANDEETELANMGFMLWGGLSHQFYKLINGTKDDISWLYHRNRAWNEANLVGYMESHDEERLIFEANKHYKNLQLSLVRAKAAVVLFFCYPGPKMLWQFGEFGYDISINQNGRTGIKPIKWEYLNEPFRQELFEIYAQMIHLKTKNVAFSKGQFEEINEGLVKKVSIKYQATEIYVFVNFGQKSIQIKANLKLRRWFDFFNETEVSFLNDSISLSAGEFRMFTSEKILKQKQ